MISSSVQWKQREAHLRPLAGIFGPMKAGSQEEDQTHEKIVEGEDFCHHGPLPAQPGYSKQPPS